MTKLLEDVIAKLRKLPAERQDEMAELIMMIFEQDTYSLQLSDEQVAEVERRLREPGECLSQAEVRAFFERRTK